MKIKKTDLKLLLLGLLLVLVMLLGLAFGSARISFSDLMNETSRLIILRLRLPRVLGAVLSGFALSIAGLLLQKANDNDLCSPTVMGTNAGAGFFVMLLLCFMPTAFYLLPIGAFAGSLVAVAIVLALSNRSTRHQNSINIILAGVALSALFNGGIAMLSQLYPDAVGSYVYFSTGGFVGVSFKDLLLPSVIITVSLFTSYMLADKIALLCLGDDLASNLSVNVKKVRIESIVLASLLTASSVSYAGLLGFVGLIVPHMANRIIGNNVKKQMIGSCLLGAILVILADLIGRCVFAPSEISAGVILSFVGAPFFIYLLRKSA